MRYVARTALVVRPKGPFVEWVNSIVPPPVQPQSLESLRNAASVYLVVECGDDPQDPNAVERRFGEIFRSELIQWNEERSLWPKRRDVATFREWFDVEPHEAVIDLDPEDVVHEDAEAE